MGVGIQTLSDVTPVMYTETDEHCWYVFCCNYNVYQH